MGCINSKEDTTNEIIPILNNVKNTNVSKSPTPSPASFADQYTLGKMIGSGTFSVVREAIHIKSGQKYAIKCIKREGLTPEDIEALTAEVTILKQMDHPNIMILYDFFTEEKYYYLVTEYMAGGELFDRIVEKSYYTEREARDLVKLLLEAVNYCHINNVVHRDLKPENLLLTSKSDDATIKLADFGFAKTVEFDSDGLTTACGTPGYVAPEILQGKKYGKGVDIWSIGVITYILLCGYPPFHDDNHNALFRKIRKGSFKFDSPYWDHVSQEAKDMIKEMLDVDPESRKEASDFLKHIWVTGEHVADVQLTSALGELKRYNARRKFKAAINTVKAGNRISKASGVSTIQNAVMEATTEEEAEDKSNETMPPVPPTTEKEVVEEQEVAKKDALSSGTTLPVYETLPTPPSAEDLIRASAVDTANSAITTAMASTVSSNKE